MIRHGASHGCATLTMTVLSGVLIFVVTKLVPHFLNFLEPFAEKMDEYLQVSYVTKETLGITLLASFLAVIWGVAFKIKQTP